MQELTLKKLVSFTQATVMLCDTQTGHIGKFKCELPIKARNEKDFAKWYKRVCLDENQKLVSVSDLRFFKRKYELLFDDLIRYGKEVEEN